MSETSLRIGLGRQGQGAELGSGMEHAGCGEPTGLDRKDERSLTEEAEEGV